MQRNQTRQEIPLVRSDISRVPFRGVLLSIVLDRSQGAPLVALVLLVLLVALLALVAPTSSNFVNLLRHVLVYVVTFLN